MSSCGTTGQCEKFTMCNSGKLRSFAKTFCSPPAAVPQSCRGRSGRSRSSDEVNHRHVSTPVTAAGLPSFVADSEDWFTGTIYGSRTTWPKRPSLCLCTINVTSNKPVVVRHFVVGRKVMPAKCARCVVDTAYDLFEIKKPWKLHIWWRLDPGHE